MERTPTSYEQQFTSEDGGNLFKDVEPHLSESINLYRYRIIELRVWAGIYCLLGLTAPTLLMLKNNITANAWSWAALLSLSAYFFRKCNRNVATIDQCHRQRIHAKERIGIFKYAVKRGNDDMVKNLVDDMRQGSADANKTLPISTETGTLHPKQYLSDAIGALTSRFNIQHE